MIKNKKVKAFLRIFFFPVFLFMAFCGLDELYYDGNSTLESLNELDKDHFDIVFLGASRTAAGFNPVILNESLGISTTIAATSAQPIALTYEIMDYIIKHYKVDAFVVDICTIPKDIDELILEGWKQFYINSIDFIRNPFERFRLIKRYFPKENYKEAYSQLFRNASIKQILKRITAKKGMETIPYGMELRNNASGYYEDLKITAELFAENSNSERIREIDSKAAGYVEKIIDLADKSNVKLYFTLLPSQDFTDYDFLSYTEMLAKKDPSVTGFINFGSSMIEYDLKNYDFSNEHHLNRLGAVKLTEYFTNLYAEENNMTPDFSKVTMFRGENVEKLSDGNYRYTVDLFPNSLIRFILKKNAKEIILETDFGKNNYIDLPKLSKGEILQYVIKPEIVYPETYPIDEQVYTFILTPERLESESKFDGDK